MTVTLYFVGFVFGLVGTEAYYRCVDACDSMLIVLGNIKERNE